MKPKHPRTAALAVAKELCDYLKPFCIEDRLKVCGSLRRGKHEVGDVEVVFVPKMEARQTSLFDKEPFDLAEEAIGRLLIDRVIEKRPNSRGIFTWGKQNKLAVHRKSGIGVDFFSTEEAHWWVTVVIRTGSKDFNFRLIAALAQKNLCLHAYGSAGITRMDTGEEVPVVSEKHVFELAGLAWMEPSERI